MHNFTARPGIIRKIIDQNQFLSIWHHYNSIGCKGREDYFQLRKNRKMNSRLFVLAGIALLFSHNLLADEGPELAEPVLEERPINNSEVNLPKVYDTKFCAINSTKSTTNIGFAIVSGLVNAVQCINPIEWVIIGGAAGVLTAVNAVSSNDKPDDAYLGTTNEPTENQVMR